MRTTPTTGDSIDQQFLDLICHDQDLLATEFDAIIAAEWPTPPADRARHGVTRRPPARRLPGSDADRLGGPTCSPWRCRIGGWVRERSPPAAIARQPRPTARPFS